MKIYYNGKLISNLALDFRKFDIPTFHVKDILVVTIPENAIPNKILESSNKIYMFIVFRCTAISQEEAATNESYLVCSEALPKPDDFLQLSYILKAGIIPGNVCQAVLSDEEMDSLYDSLQNPQMKKFPWK